MAKKSKSAKSPKFDFSRPDPENPSLRFFKCEHCEMEIKCQQVTWADLPDEVKDRLDSIEDEEERDVDSDDPRYDPATSAKIDVYLRGSEEDEIGQLHFSLDRVDANDLDRDMEEAIDDEMDEVALYFCCPKLEADLRGNEGSEVMVPCGTATDREGDVNELDVLGDESPWVPVKHVSPKTHVKDLEAE